MALEAGFARSRETVNVLLECVFDTCLCGLLYWAIGFAFQFGVGNGFIGHQYFFLHGMTAGLRHAPASRSSRSCCSSSPSPTPPRPSPRAPWSAAPASRATSSTASCVSGFIYPIFGHWVWGPGGWLEQHACGWSSQLRHRRRRSSVTSPARPSCTPSAASSPSPAPSPSGRASAASSSATAAAQCRPTTSRCGAIGGVILWFGWYGFNPGSTLSAMDWRGHRPGRGQHHARRLRRRHGRRALRLSADRRSGTSASRSTASSAASSPSPCPCYWVVAVRARSCIGAVAGIVVPLGIDLLEHLRIDDPIGAVPVHVFCRHLGHAEPRAVRHRAVRRPDADGADTSTVVKGLFYGGGVDQLMAQFIGSLACVHRRRRRRR